jgi:HD-GYP domain-containing protein (c-di-GMP phosphodiesterase class II)
MTDTKSLLTRIASLRQQLEQVEGLEIGEQGGSSGPAAARLSRIEQQVAAATEQDRQLDRALRQLSPEATASENRILPQQLTARAHRLLEQGRGLLERLRALAAEFEAPAPAQAPCAPSVEAAVWPLTRRYQQSAAMAETALRLVQVFPEAASAQIPLCDGLEAILNTVAEHVAGLEAAVARQRQERQAIDNLSDLLSTLHAGRPVGLQAFAGLAEAVLAEAADSPALPFPEVPVEPLARLIASHSLAVARVMARLVRQDPELRREPTQPVLMALLHDAGMLAVPGEILAQPGPLDAAQRRAVEAHVRAGAERLIRLAPAAGWLAEAAERHHERLDGTGYPDGLKGPHLSTCLRLLAVCDVYVALCSPRPHRPARDTRTALTDTLLLAERGTLDRFQAERLLQLSFYPVGSVVELADGAVGLVVATHAARRDLLGPARPVLALLTDSQGQPLPSPQHVDLAQCESRSIVRSLSRKERQEILGQRYPELA